jgi:cold shock CspA family protein/ribosome-associated translation inhibitor RaiA
VEIHWTHPDPIPAAQRETAEARLRALAEGHTDLIDVRITVRPSNHHRHGGHEVRIACQARGRELVATRSLTEIGPTLDEALDAIEREVRRLRDRRSHPRGAAAAGPPELGIVDTVFAERGYGFIITDAGERVYFHRNAVRGGLAFDRLTEGQRVGLDFEAGEQGLQATAVVAPPPGASPV